MSSSESAGLAEVWLPESPRHRVTADVSFQNDRGVVLRLLGGPAEPNADLPEKQEASEASPTVISGLEELTDAYLAGQPKEIPELRGTVGDVPFLVLDATLHLVSGFAGQAPLVEITANAVLLEFPGNRDSAVFDRMLVTTPHLTELAMAGGLHPQWAWPEGQGGPIRFSASAEPVNATHGIIERPDGKVDVTMRLHHTQPPGLRAAPRSGSPAARYSGCSLP